MPSLGYPAKHTRQPAWGSQGPQVKYNITSYPYTRINEDLMNVANWCKKNKLSLNIKKTKFALYGTKYRLQNHGHVDLLIDGQNLLRTHQYRYLGLELDSDLNFKGHVKVVQKSLSYKSYLLSRLRMSLTQDATLDIVKTMVLLVVDYGQLVYGAGHKNTLDRMLRLCYYQQRNSSIEELRILAGLDTLDLRRTKAVKSASFKYAQVPENRDTRHISTRRHDATLVKVVWYKTSKARQGVSYRLAHSWNSLDVDLRRITSHKVFKNAINSNTVS